MPHRVNFLLYDFGFPIGCWIVFELSCVGVQQSQPRPQDDLLDLGVGSYSCRSRSTLVPFAFESSGAWSASGLQLWKELNR